MRGQSERRCSLTHLRVARLRTHINILTFCGGRNRTKRTARARAQKFNYFTGLSSSSSTLLLPPPTLQPLASQLQRRSPMQQETREECLKKTEERQVLNLCNGRRFDYCDSGGGGASSSGCVGGGRAGDPAHKTILCAFAGSFASSLARSSARRLCDQAHRCARETRRHKTRSTSAIDLIPFDLNVVCPFC